MNQLDFFSTYPTEEWAFTILRPTLLQTITNNNLSAEKLRLENGKNYSSVWYDTQMAFRICLRKEFHYLSISDSFIQDADENISRLMITDGGNKGFTNISFDPTEEALLSLAPFLSMVLDKTIDCISKEFDCCSRYEECSNQRKCVNPNPDIAVGCGYRKIMKKGRIFYGPNRNVD